MNSSGGISEILCCVGMIMYQSKGHKQVAETDVTPSESIIMAGTALAVGEA